MKFLLLSLLALSACSRNGEALRLKSLVPQFSSMTFVDLGSSSISLSINSGTGPEFKWDHIYDEGATWTFYIDGKEYKIRGSRLAEMVRAEGSK